MTVIILLHQEENILLKLSVIYVFSVDPISWLFHPKDFFDSVKQNMDSAPVLIESLCA